MIIKRSISNSSIIVPSNNGNNSPVILERKDSEDSAEITVNNNLVQKGTRIHARKKKITFSPEVIMTETFHHKNYTKSEKKKCWYNLEDFSQIKQENKESVILTKGGRIQMQDHCFRGLENRVYESAMLRKRRRYQARMAVFEEQEMYRQRAEFAEGLFLKDAEEKAIAARYNSQSNACAYEAYNRGLMDEMEASKEHYNKKLKPVSATTSSEVPRTGKNINICAHKKQQHKPLVYVFSNLLKKHKQSFESYLSH